MPRAAVDSGSLDSHEHLVVGDRWHGTSVHTDDVGIAIAVMHSRAHGRRYRHLQTVVESEIAVDERRGHGALSDGGRDALDGAVPKVSGDEHAWLA